MSQFLYVTYAHGSDYLSIISNNIQRVNRPLKMATGHTDQLAQNKEGEYCVAELESRHRCIIMNDSKIAVSLFCWDNHI